MQDSNLDMIVLMDLDLMKTRGKASKVFLFVSKVYGRMPPVETMRDLEYSLGIMLIDLAAAYLACSLEFQ